MWCTLIPSTGSTEATGWHEFRRCHSQIFACHHLALVLAQSLPCFHNPLLPRAHHLHNTSSSLKQTLSSSTYSAQQDATHHKQLLEVPPLLYYDIHSYNVRNSNMMLVIYGVTWPLSVQVLPRHVSSMNTSRLIQIMFIVLPQLGRIITVLIISVMIPIISSILTLTDNLLLLL